MIHNKSISHWVKFVKVGSNQVVGKVKIKISFFKNKTFKDKKTSAIRKNENERKPSRSKKITEKSSSIYNSAKVTREINVSTAHGQYSDDFSESSNQISSYSSDNDR